MEVKLDYFNPKNGLAMTIDQRIEELYKTEREIYIPELNKTYGADSVQELKTAVVRHFESSDCYNSETLKVSASVLVDEGQSGFDDDGELLEGEQMLRAYKVLMTIIWVICIIGSFILGILSKNPIWLLFTVLECVSLYLSSVIVKFPVLLSQRIRKIEEKLRQM